MLQLDVKRIPLLNEVLGAATIHANLNVTYLPSLEGVQLAKKHEADAISHASAHPSPAEAVRLKRLRQAVAIISKNPTIAGSTDEARKRSAISTFNRHQQRNHISTKRLNFYFRHPSRMPPLVGMALEEARLDLFRLLGPAPSDKDWATFLSAKVFSKGVTQGLKVHQKTGKKDTDPYAKTMSTTTITGSSTCLATYGHLLLKGSWGSHLRDLQSAGKLRISESDCSVVSMQPKDAQTDRAIATEPMLNAMAQQGLRAMLGRYLRRWGITLDDQSANRKLARKASILGFSPDGYATIDKSSASDTVLDVLVRWLLPLSWYRLLDAARTHMYELEGERRPSLMFSTMGNAFTFPVECLVFGALTRACIRLTDCPNKDYRVYGDDVILPLSASALYIEVTQFAGFKVNEAKSFVLGHFRESCGGDYLDGIDVAPVRLKGNISYLTERHKLFNGLQQSDPGSPVLGVLFDSVEKPLIGPAIGPDGGETSHFVAPVWYLKDRGWATWKNSVQSYSYRYTGLFGSSRRRSRTDVHCRLLACLAGAHGGRHDLRDTVQYRVHVRETTTPFVAVRVAPFWYSESNAR